MDLYDMLSAANRTKISVTVSSHPSTPPDPLLKGEQIGNHNDGSTPGRPQELAQDVLQPERRDQGSADIPCLPTAGSMLSLMMTLNPSRAPLATQEELRVTLQHFSKRAVTLPRDTFFYTQAGFVELLSQAMEKRLMDASQPGELSVGIQRLSRVASQLPRYWALLQPVRSICLYGLNDLRLDPEREGFVHSRLATLVFDRSRQTDLEWFRFIVIDTPELFTALVTRQIEGDLWADSPQLRTYMGLWTFNCLQVQQMVCIFRQVTHIQME